MKTGRKAKFEQKEGLQYCCIVNAEWPSGATTTSGSPEVMPG